VIVKEIYKLSNENSGFVKDYSFKDQIRRAAVSSMLNIAEGFGRRSHKEFKQFLFVAHASLEEVQSALYIAFDLSYINENDFKELYELCIEDCRIISGLIKTL